MRFRPVVVAAVVLLALAGCTPATPYGTDSPAPSTTPVFASDADALKAAEAAYAAYLKVSDQIFVDGGQKPERLRSVATESVYKEELVGFKSVTANGWHSTGGTFADNFQLESYSPQDRASTVSVYLCSDVSEVDVIDASGKSVVSSARPNRTAFEVGFAYRESAVGRLVVASQQPWSGGGIC